MNELAPPTLCTAHFTGHLSLEIIDDGQSLRWSQTGKLVNRQGNTGGERVVSSLSASPNEAVPAPTTSIVEAIFAASAFEDSDSDSEFDSQSESESSALSWASVDQPLVVRRRSFVGHQGAEQPFTFLLARNMGAKRPAYPAATGAASPQRGRQTEHLPKPPLSFSRPLSQLQEFRGALGQIMPSHSLIRRGYTVVPPWNRSSTFSEGQAEADEKKERAQMLDHRQSRSDADGKQLGGTITPSQIHLARQSCLPIIGE